MVCKTAPGCDNEKSDAALAEVNREAAKLDCTGEEIETYLAKIFEAIRIGAIRELVVQGCTYELYADILETEG